MPNLMVSVSHQLSQEDALRRIRAVVAHAKVQYADKINDLRDSWKGYVGTFDGSGMGQKASGSRRESIRCDSSNQATVRCVAVQIEDRIWDS